MRCWRWVWSLPGRSAAPRKLSPMDTAAVGAPPGSRDQMEVADEARLETRQMTVPVTDPPVVSVEVIDTGMV